MKSESHSRGNLVKWALPEQFLTKEVFIIDNVPVGMTRGGHAHHTCTQILILLNGRIEVELEDSNGLTKHHLSESNSILEIKPLTWGIQKYLTKETQLVVLSSEYFNEAEYIRDYLEFKQIIKRVAS